MLCVFTGAPLRHRSQAAAIAEEDGAEAKAAQLKERMEDPRNNAMLDLLCDEAGFLVDGKAKSMLAKLPKNEQGVVLVEHILEELGATDGPAFDALSAALTDGQAADSATPALVDPTVAVKRLRTFLDANRHSRPRTSGGAVQPNTSESSVPVANQEDRDKEFWERLSQVIQFNLT